MTQNWNAKCFHNLRCLLSSLLLAALVTALFLPITAQAAASWPTDAIISADGGILVDADSGAVLYAKNPDQAYYPASITKLLTALIIVENCNLDDMITFSENAVFNVEAGSSNMGVSPGDRLSVRDCLYGLLLASANECANALAEHCSGSIEAFADLMNQRAEALGCTGSHFANPSGLNNENHFTTARDMSKIMGAALKNPTFLEIDQSLYWKHGPIKRYPDPEDSHNVVYAHHAMLKKNDSRYYPGAFAGKTGYTSLAGNTLVTCAKQGNMTLICVVLNGHLTHYADTKTLFNFGFRNFKTLKVSEYDTNYTSIVNDMTIQGLTSSPISTLSIDDGCYVSMPVSADFSEVDTSLDYDLSSSSAVPEGAIAKVNYEYDGHFIGSSFLKMFQDSNARSASLAAVAEALPSLETIPAPGTNAETTGTAETTQSGAVKLPSEIRIPAALWIFLAVAAALTLIITCILLIKMHIEKKEDNARYIRRENRKNRLNDIGYTQTDFDLIVEERKRSSYKAPKPRWHGRRRHD